MLRLANTATPPNADSRDWLARAAQVLVPVARAGAWADLEFAPSQWLTASRTVSGQ